MENIMNELEKLLKDLYKISGLNMSIFDLNQNLLASYPHKKSKFCNELEKNNNAFQHCIDCDYKAMEHVKETGELYIYKCHFGLNEAIMPLYSYGSLTGYLMMGQEMCIRDSIKCIISTQPIATKIAVKIPLASK